MADLKDFCRTCLNYDSLFEYNYNCVIRDETSILGDMLKTCTGIDITVADDYPNKLCSQCATVLAKFYAFRLRCLVTQDVLKPIVNFTTNLKSNEPKDIKVTQNALNRIQDKLGTNAAYKNISKYLTELHNSAYISKSEDPVNFVAVAPSNDDSNIKVEASLDDFEVYFNDHIDNPDVVYLESENECKAIECISLKDEPVNKHAIKRHSSDASINLHTDKVTDSHLCPYETKAECIKKCGPNIVYIKKGNYNRVQQNKRNFRMVSTSFRNEDAINAQPAKYRKVTTPKTFDCECGKQYSRKFHLERHQSVKKHGQFKIDYVSCEEVKDDEQIDLDLNVSLHDSEDIFDTSENLSSSDNKDILSNNSGMFVCECGKRYGRKHHLFRHQVLQNHLSVNTSYEETILDNENSFKGYRKSDDDFENEDDMIMIDMKGDIILSDDQVNKEGSLPIREGSYKRHTFDCRCGRKYSRREYLTRHHQKFKSHAENDTYFKLASKESPTVDKTGIFDCSCGKRYGRKEHLIRHQKVNAHGQYEIYSSSWEKSDDENVNEEYYLEPAKVWSDSTVAKSEKENISLSSDKDVLQVRAKKRSVVNQNRVFACHCGKQYGRKHHLTKHQKVQKHGEFKIVTSSLEGNDSNNGNADGEDILEPSDNVTNISETKKDVSPTNKQEALNVKNEMSGGSKLRRFDCPCGKFYGRKHHLAKHQKVNGHGEYGYESEKDGASDGLVKNEIEGENGEKGRLGKKQRTELIENRVFQCECGKICKRKDNLTRHQIAYRHADYKCISDVKKDEVTKVQRANSFLCNECGKVFFSKYNLELHCRRHKGMQHLCYICGLCLSSPSHLRYHMRMHTNEKPFKCDFQGCQKAFSNGAGLKSHKLTHTDIRKYECKQCDRKFKQPSALYLHTRLHSGIKMFKCTLCDASFAAKDTLVTHNRTHTGEKPFGCQLCEKRFSMKSSLRIHIRRHTQDKPYKCQLCSFAAVSGDVLTRHKHRRHTGNRKYPCKYVGCDKKFFSPSERSKHQSRHLKMKDDLKENPIKSLGEEIKVSDEVREEEPLQESIENEEYIIEEYEDVNEDDDNYVEMEHVFEEDTALDDHQDEYIDVQELKI